MACLPVEQGGNNTHSCQTEPKRPTHTCRPSQEPAAAAVEGAGESACCIGTGRPRGAAPYPAPEPGLAASLRLLKGIRASSYSTPECQGNTGGRDPPPAQEGARAPGMAHGSSAHPNEGQRASPSPQHSEEHGGCRGHFAAPPSPSPDAQRRVLPPPSPGGQEATGSSCGGRCQSPSLSGRPKAPGSHTKPNREAEERLEATRVLDRPAAVLPLRSRTHPSPGKKAQGDC